MPLLSLASGLAKALDSGLGAIPVSYESSSNSLICEVEQPIRNGAPVLLRFSDGSRLDAVSSWQRTNSRAGPYLTAFRASPPELPLETAPSPGHKLRGSLRVPMRLWVSFENGDGTVTADLSPEGCRVQGELDPRQGEPISLYLDLPDQCGPLRASAEVVWSRGGETGLRFLNLCAGDEIRLLRCLGHATISTSSFLPQHFSTAPPFLYLLEQTDSGLALRISVTNWDFIFHLDHATIEGEMKGAFRHCEVKMSSPELLSLKQDLKISLEQERHLLHLVLFDGEDRAVLEVVAQETGFQRLPRSHAMKLRDTL